MCLIFVGKCLFPPLLFQLSILLVFHYRFLQSQQQTVLLYVRVCACVPTYTTYMLITMWFLSFWIHCNYINVWSCQKARSHKEIVFELVLIGNGFIPKSQVIFLEGSPHYASQVLYAPVQAVTKHFPASFEVSFPTTSSTEGGHVWVEFLPCNRPGLSFHWHGPQCWSRQKCMNSISQHSVILYGHTAVFRKVIWWVQNELHTDSPNSSGEKHTRQVPSHWLLLAELEHVLSIKCLSHQRPAKPGKRLPITVCQRTTYLNNSWLRGKSFKSKDMVKKLKQMYINNIT